MMLIFRKTKKYIENIILLLILLSAASLMFTGLVTGKATIFGIRPLIVTTDSMLPAIPVGSLLIGVPVEPEEVQQGDVIAYRAGEKDCWIHPVIVHQVIEVTDEGFIFQGDNNPEPDSAVVTKEQILFKILGME